METAIYDGICRCCASEGSFKDVNDTYHWMGEEEVYADMLKECFNVSLSLSAEQNGGICEVCITQLRNASNFKKQVLHTEEQFQKHLHMKIFKPVKIEVDTLENKHENDDNSSIEDGFSGTEIDMPIKSEDTPEEAKPKKRAAKTAKSKTKKSKSEKAETSNQRRLPSSDVEFIEEEPPKLKLDKKKNFSTFIAIRPVVRRIQPKVREQNRIVQQRRLTELGLHFDNITTVLNYSNATPVRCRVDEKYACSYCLVQFENPTHLKSHTLELHRKHRPEFFHNRQTLSKLIVILDITGLRCDLCEIESDKLDLLMIHLKTDHKQQVHTHINNQIVPVKFEGAQANCGVCGVVVEDFNKLHDHITVHYRNYVCDYCEKGFMTRAIMMDHKKEVHRV